MPFTPLLPSVQHYYLYLHLAWPCSIHILTPDQDPLLLAQYEDLIMQSLCFS